MHISLEAVHKDGHSVLPYDLPYAGKNPEEHCEAHELKTNLFIEIGRFEPAYRAVIQMCDREEHSYLETVNALNLSVSGVRSRLTRGREKLRFRLGRHVKDLALIDQKA